MAGELAGFSRDNAKLILDVVRYLRASGFVVPQQSRGRQTLQPETPIYVRNDSGVEIPAFACLQTTGTVEYGGQNYITVDQPADTDGTSGGYLFNGQAPIGIGGYGIAHDGPVVRMICGDTIASGDPLIPIVNDWEVELGDGPFVAIGEDDIATNCIRGFVAMGGGGTATRDTIIVKTKVGGIPARSGTTIGAADCDVFEVVGTTLTDAGYDVEVINITTSTVGGGSYGVASRELNSDQWVLIVEECVGSI
jgi:hypothetical protein